MFWGADSGPVTIRDNSGVTSPGVTGTVDPDDGGGLDLRSPSSSPAACRWTDAMDPDNLLCYEMNGEPLPPSTASRCG